MSYCVNCGVKLAPSEKKCPLCGVPVVNPRDPWVEPSHRPYPKQVERVMHRIDRRYGAALASLLLLIPLMLTVISDVIVNRAVTWSLYVVGAGACLFVWVLLPLLLKKPSPLPCVLGDALAALLYLGLISTLADSSGWFLPLALPLVLIAAGLVLGISQVIRSRKIRGLRHVSWVFLLLGVASILVDGVIHHFIAGSFAPFWSLFVCIPCLVFAILFMMLERKQKLKDEIRRRLFL
ncbi:MAG: zinc ribbon domain-containing protein [Clostridiales bacterium]|nr:zinc ribbon domain-containing protein [Clostridiales bacterium]